MPQFSDFGLITPLMKAVETMGFKEPMPIQAAVIPLLLQKDTDVVGLAQTGTGKTAAFGLPLLQNIDVNKKKTQALILCPTRELCLQITKDLDNFAQFMSGVNITAVYGGASIEMQFKELYKNPQIIVATPGRLQDMIRRNKVDFSEIRWVVLDEADEMLDMGFQEEVDNILSTMPTERHTLLFSATMPIEVEKILHKYMKNPVTKSVGQRNSGTSNVRHSYFLVHAKERYLALKRLLDFNPSIYAIVFCRTRAETQEVADLLVKDGYNAAALHGDLSQAQRDHVMTHFRQRSLQILVATDVAARGLDVNDLTHVINYSLPDEPETYVHRSGRTGRADKTGVCISLVNLREKGKIKQIEKQLAQPISQAQIPSGKQVCEKQLFNHIDRIENIEINHEQINDYLPIVFRKLEWMSREELITRMVSVNFNRFLDYYKDAQDINVDESREERREGKGRSKRERGGSSDRGSRDEGLKRLFINIGRRDRVKPNNIIGLINEVTHSRDIRIGRIDVMDSFSFIDVDENSVQQILDSFSDERRNPDGVRVEVVKNDKSEGGEGGSRSNRRKSAYGGERSSRGKRSDKGGERSSSRDEGRGERSYSDRKKSSRNEHGDRKRRR